MSKPIKPHVERIPPTGKAFEEYCDFALNLIATEVDEINETLLDNRCNVSRLREKFDLTIEDVFSLEGRIDGLTSQMTELRSCVKYTANRTIVYSAALFGAAVLTSIFLRKGK